MNEKALKLFTGKTVIIVDDNKSARARLKSLYESLGFNIVGEAENGIEALSMIESVRCDLLSLDIIMPVMDGIECFRCIKDNDNIKYKDIVKNLKIIFVTCLAKEQKVINAFKGEIDPGHFINKYPSKEDFSIILKKLLFGNNKIEKLSA